MLKRISRRKIATLASVIALTSFLTCLTLLAQEPKPGRPAAATGGLDLDVVYGKGDGQDLHMDIAKPASGDGPFPVVVCIHGGAWRGGNKQRYHMLIKQLAQQGYVAVTVQYRLVPHARFPSQVEDVKCAVRYLRAHAAELKINPDRIGAMGESAGGHLSLMLATTDAKSGMEGGGGWADQSSRIQAEVNFFGPTDMTLPYPEGVQPLLTNFIGGTLQEKPNEHRAASPITYLTADDPPIITFHGTADNVVPYEQATVLDAACKKIGVPHELVTIQDGAHGFQGEDLLRTLKLMVEFFDEHLKKQ